MATDQHWAAVYEVVLTALVEDRAIHLNPPKTEQEVEWVAETVTDHIVGCFECKRRSP